MKKSCRRFFCLRPGLSEIVPNEAVLDTVLRQRFDQLDAAIEQTRRDHQLPVMQSRLISMTASFHRLSTRDNPGRSFLWPYLLRFVCCCFLGTFNIVARLNDSYSSVLSQKAIRVGMALTYDGVPNAREIEFNSKSLGCRSPP
jgi:hypothetical protein